MFRSTKYLSQLIYRQSSRQLSNTADFAFVFDIDGVLVRGSKPLPGAKPALELLRQNQVPFLLLTNGGGVTETERASFLSERIGVPLSPRQLVQSHTPMKSYIGQWDRVMVVGGPYDSARKCAIEYGFKDVLMPHDLVNATPGISPHHRYSKEFLDRYALSPSEVDLDKPVDAVLVFNDCRDMGTDIQVILDLLNSENGKIGTKRPVSGGGTEPAIPIIFSNNDFLWAADYPLPRFGQGAIRMMVERLYKEQNNGAELRSKILGKPFVSQYEFAAKTLVEWSGGQRFRHFYMVGDNPASDIQGANRSAWRSLLLRTGVYTDGDDIPLDSRPSEGVFDDVLDAVKHVLKSQ
ncbi:hypothetical protein QA089_005318 [Meyerozyma guilliermondii]